MANGEYTLRNNPHTFFFYAEKTGTVNGVQIGWRQRAPEPSNYSSGDGGTYTIQIKPASASTKRETSGGSVICSIAGIRPGNPTGNSTMWREYNFTNTGSLTAGQPYVIKIINTHNDAFNNHVSVNVTRYYVWYTNYNPPNFTEPGGGGAVGQINVASGGIRGHAVGSNIARIRGYAPHSIQMGGSNFLLYPVPIGYEAGDPDHHHRRLGGIQCSLRYSDGTYTNWGRGSGSFPEQQVNIIGNTQVRQRFRVTRASRTVRGVFVMGWVNGTAGSLNVRLESGPETDAHFPGNGTLIEQVSVPATWFLNAGARLDHNQFQAGCDTCALDLVHYVWVPFRTNRTLTLGRTYNLRLVPNGCNFFMQGGARGDDQYGVYGRNASTWSSWARNRRISWTTFEDSRGPQVSRDGGATWAYWPAGAQQIPITFKGV
jgi:hypothetical protein